MAEFSYGDDSGDNPMAPFMGPGQVDLQIRQALQMCWMMLPKDRRNIDEVERQIRRLVNRALQDFREDEGELRPAEDD